MMDSNTYIRPDMSCIQCSAHHLSKNHVLPLVVMDRESYAAMKVGTSTVHRAEVWLTSQVSSAVYIKEQAQCGLLLHVSSAMRSLLCYWNSLELQS